MSRAGSHLTLIQDDEVTSNTPRTKTLPDRAATVEGRRVSSRRAPSLARPRGRPIGAVPKMPIREQSSITNFDPRVGDSSRVNVVIAVGVTALLLGGILVFTKTPPGPETLEGDAIEIAGDLSLPPSPATLAESMSPATLTAPATPESVSPATLTTPTTPATLTTAAEPAAPSGPPAPGVVVLTSDPAVDVYLGKTLLGHTPLDVRLPAGRQQLRFADPNTGLNAYRTIKVRAGAETEENVHFDNGVLLVDAPYGATVTLNSRLIGIAPLEEVRVYEGKYFLKVVYEGVSWTQEFELAAGETIRYRVDFHAMQ